MPWPLAPEAYSVSTNTVGIYHNVIQTFRGWRRRLEAEGRLEFQRTPGPAPAKVSAHV